MIGACSFRRAFARDEASVLRVLRRVSMPCWFTSQGFVRRIVLMQEIEVPK
jgi:hypothetical protein